jgi:hypothetical protein
VDGPIELTFADGSVLLCDTAADWTLQFFGSAWKDPMPGPLSPDERQYVERYGKWGGHDVSGVAPYSWLIGETVNQVVPQLNELLELSGLLIRTDNAALDLQLWAGELRTFVRRG